MSDNEHGLAPSASTNASAVAAFLAATLMIILERYGIHAPAGYEALLGGAIATLGGYIPKSGRMPQ